jgi:hypothetical protein
MNLHYMKEIKNVQFIYTTTNIGTHDCIFKNHKQTRLDYENLHKKHPKKVID